MTSPLSLANRGRGLELMVERSNDVYRAGGEALVHKVPSEWIPIRGAAGRIVTAKISRRAAVDFLGYTMAALWPSMPRRLGRRPDLPCRSRCYPATRWSSFEPSWEGASRPRSMRSGQGASGCDPAGGVRSTICSAEGVGWGGWTGSAE